MGDDRTRYQCQKVGNPLQISRNNRSILIFPFSTEDVVRAKKYVNMGGALQALVTDRDPPLSEMI